MDTNWKLPNTDNEQDVRVSFTKFDRNVPDDFLSARHNEINEYINTLEGDVTTQEHINNVYSDLVVFCKGRNDKQNRPQANKCCGRT